MTGNPQGANTLANELLGSLIAKSVGLPVAEGKGIYLPDGFIDSCPDLWFEFPFGKCRPDKGLHFASLFVGQPAGPKRPSEYISPSRIGMISNRDAFLGMYILDIWANHQDNRQAVFLRRQLDETQEVFFIDHGHMFGGSEWNFQERPGIAFHMERAVYSGLWQDEDIASWISHFRTVVPDVLSWCTSAVSSQWYSGNLNSLICVLTDRLASLTELVQADAAKSWQLASQKSKKDDTLRLSDSGIHDVGTPDTRSPIRGGGATACA
jgi:hypothetical protein